MEQLAFFDPDDNKYGFTVMPFGPVNNLPFNTFMMGAFKTKWDILFIEVMTGYATSNTLLVGQRVTISEGVLSIGFVKNTSGTKSIIDDFLYGATM